MTGLANYTYEVTTGVGTGNIRIEQFGIFRRFHAAFGVGSDNWFYYGIHHRDNEQYEVGKGYILDNGNNDTLVRDEVIESSNGDASLVEFSPGIKDVINNLPANQQLSSDDADAAYLLLDGTNSMTDAVDYDPGSDTDIDLWSFRGTTIAAWDESEDNITSTVPIVSPSKVVEITGNTTLSDASHNGAILICTGNATLTAPTTLSVGFICWIRPETTEEISVTVTSPDTLEGTAGDTYDIVPFNNAYAQLLQWEEGAFLINGNVNPTP